MTDKLVLTNCSYYRSHQQQGMKVCHLSLLRASLDASGSGIQVDNSKCHHCLIKQEKHDNDVCLAMQQIKRCVFQQLQQIQKKRRHSSMDYPHYIPNTFYPLPWQFCQQFSPLTVVSSENSTNHIKQKLQRQVDQKQMVIQDLQRQLQASKRSKLCSQCNGSLTGPEGEESPIFHELPQHTVFKKKYECPEEGCRHRYSSRLALRNHLKAKHQGKVREGSGRV